MYLYRAQRRKYKYLAMGMLAATVVFYSCLIVGAKALFAFQNQPIDCFSTESNFDDRGGQGTGLACERIWPRVDHKDFKKTALNFMQAQVKTL
eukprot:8998709-Pyramimonas_sp.AAC.1